MTGASTVSETHIREIELTNRAYARCRRRSGFVNSCLFLSFIFVTQTFAQAQSSDISRLVGDWTGESICVNKEKFPACKDEHVVYHIAITPKKTNTVTLKADKIVNGKPDFMGEFDFLYDPKKQTLITEFKNSRVHLTIELVVKDDVIEGIMASYPERTIARNIKVKKNR